MYEQIARNKRRTVVYIVLFAVVWAGIGALVGWIWALAAASTAQRVPVAADITTGVIAAAVLALIGIAFSLRSGAKLVLAVSGAQPADPYRFRQLHDLVEALAIGDGLAKPAVYVIDDPSPNAFATGTSPDHAAITVTTGLLRTMNREELEGVLGH